MEISLSGDSGLESSTQRVSAYYRFDDDDIQLLLIDPNQE